MKIENSLGRGMKSFLLKFQKLNFPHTRFWKFSKRLRRTFGCKFVMTMKNPTTRREMGKLKIPPTNGLKFPVKVKNFEKSVLWKFSSSPASAPQSPLAVVKTLVSVWKERRAKWWEFACFWQRIVKISKNRAKVGLPPFLLYEEDSSVLKCFGSWVVEDIFWQDRSELRFSKSFACVLAFGLLDSSCTKL